MWTVEKQEWIFSGVEKTIKNFSSMFTNFFEDIINKAKIKINEMCGKEIFQVIETTKKDLKNLEDDVLKIKDDEISNNKLSSEETKLLNKLNDKEKFNDYFKFLKDNISDDDLIISEKELIIKMPCIVIRISWNYVTLMKRIQKKLKLQNMI